MSKLNFTVEAEVNGEWVHANVATLSEAKAVSSAFEALENAIDIGIHITKNASPEAREELRQYSLESAAKVLANLDKQSPGLFQWCLDNGVYTGNMTNA